MPQTKKYGKGQRECRRCHTNRAIIRRYGLNLCRRCFYEVARDVGWKRFE